MPLNTDAEIRAIIDTQLTDLDPFINLAALVIDEQLTGLSAARLKEIERWLAAHFIVIREELGGIESETIAGVSFNYAAVAEKGFGSTRYGQQAIALDTSGKLGGAAGQPKAKFRVI